MKTCQILYGNECIGMYIYAKKEEVSIVQNRFERETEKEKQSKEIYFC